jgi:Ppx/GppA phosphatase family/CHAD domain
VADFLLEETVKFMYKTLAAIDIGSNTVHLVAAVAEGNHLTILADDSIFVRLADGVWNRRYIPEERIIATTQAMLYLREIARGFGAEHIAVVATEVARTARNTPALLSAIEATTGLNPVVLSGLDEATLMFRGVTNGRNLPSNVAVGDLGGGSLELIIAELGYTPWRASLPIGSAFMHDRFIQHDPPLPEEIEELEIYLAEAFKTIPRLAHIEELLMCGGTVNALMRLIQQVQRRASGDRVLRRADLDHVLRIMLESPSSLIAGDYHLRFERARLLPTGALILAKLLDHLDLPGILVNQAGIREGVILAMAAHGRDWLEKTRANANEWQDRENGVQSAPILESLPPLAWEPASKAAWTLINQQLNTMLKYRKPALAGDIDAVHDMRVASRRLRTMLDTFAPCFVPDAVRNLRRALKRIARALGEVRDADVALESLHVQLEEAEPELVLALNKLIASREEQRRYSRRALRKYLRSSDVQHLCELVDGLALTTEHIVSPLVIRAAGSTESLYPKGGTK